jgi:drug/metabolite transporter (DMT)-like permease
MERIMQPAINRSMEFGDWLQLALLSLVWGGSFFFVAIALEGLQPLTIVALRVSIAAACLWIVVAFSRPAPLPGRARPVQWLIMGAINNAVPFSFIVWSQQHIGSGHAAILNATTPLFTVLAAHVALRDEPLRIQAVAGIAAGLVGVVLIVDTGRLGTGGQVAADLAMLLAAVSYACASVYGRRFGGDPAMVTAAGQLTGSSLIMIPLALAVDRPWSAAAPSAGSLAAVGGLAVLSTAFAYVVYFGILRRAGATNLMLVTLLVPPTALLLGVMFLGEELAAADMLGLAAIGLGLVVIDGRLVGRWFRVAPGGKP